MSRGLLHALYVGNMTARCDSPVSVLQNRCRINARAGDGTRNGCNDEGVADSDLDFGADDELVTQLPTGLRLFRRVADSLALPMFLVDAGGDLVYYNRPAAVLLGQPYTRPLRPAEWGGLWTPTNIDGAGLALEQLPVMVALRTHRPVHRWLNIVGLDGVHRRLEVTAFPLVVEESQVLGALALFWQQDIL